MRVVLKIAAVAAAAAAALAVGLGPAALADPTTSTSPSLTTLTGVGSDTVAALLDNGTGTTSPACKGGARGWHGVPHV
jgi:ABC-type phosphate transport system substrate-binding protein